MSQYQDDNELDDWGPSKSQLKRDAEALQKLGAEIVLPEPQRAGTDPAG